MDSLRFSSTDKTADLKKLFLTYQLLNTLRYCHNNGIIHGKLQPSSIPLTQNKLWLYMCGFEFPSTPLYTDLESSEENLATIMAKWMSGQVSNFDYLMYLNQLCGRRKNHPEFHPVFPWIMDFSQENGGWRDLTKSKYRMTKGTHVTVLY
jgi:WD repeat-containing protein 81